MTDDRRPPLAPPAELLLDVSPHELSLPLGELGAFMRLCRAIEAVNAQALAVHRFACAVADELDEQRAEQIEQRRSIAALANRIEAVSRALASRTDHLA